VRGTGQTRARFSWRAGWVGSACFRDLGVVSTFRRQFMSAIPTVRFASSIGTFLLVLFTAFPSFPKIGAGLYATTPAVAVDRTLKGDRLPVSRLIDWPSEPGSTMSPARLPAEIPTGCDPAFSPISSPAMAHVFRRCVA
jgi:hypothetical protein